MNIFSKILTFAAPALIAVSCTSVGNRPGWEYAPDMYYAKGYEPYSQPVEPYEYNPYGMSLRTPVEGSISKGHLDEVYAYENSGEGYEAAGAGLTMPADIGVSMEHAKDRFVIYCAPCHGETGKNDGTVFKKVSTLKPAWSGYSDEYIKSLPDGKIYHTLMYGKNNMGSHASVLTPAERWAVIKYVRVLSIGGTAEAAGLDETETETEETKEEAK